MIGYKQACQLIANKFIKEDEDIDAEILLKPLMDKHEVLFTDDLTWILSEYFQIKKEKSNEGL